MTTIRLGIFGAALKIPQFLYRASFPEPPAKLSEHPLSSSEYYSRLPLPIVEGHYGMR